MALAVFPGVQATSAWAWVLIGAWFGVLPLVLLTIALYYRAVGKEPGADEQED